MAGAARALRRKIRRERQARELTAVANEEVEVYRLEWFSLMVPRNSGRDLAPVAQVAPEPVAVASSGPFPRPLCMRLRSAGPESDNSRSVATAGAPGKAMRANGACKRLKGKEKAWMA